MNHDELNPDVEKVSPSEPKAGQEQALAEKARLIARLKEAGITRIEAEYDGYGDSGCVWCMTAYSGDVEVSLEEALAEGIEDFVYSQLPHGWEIDGGSCGIVIFDVVANLVSFEHNTRYTMITPEEWLL